MKKTFLVLNLIIAVASQAQTVVPAWVQRYNGPSDSNDYAVAAAVDDAGNVIVTGYSPGIGSGNDYATIKYSNFGLPLWTNRYNGSGNKDDTASALAIDKNGNVFVTGSSVGSLIAPWDSDYLTIAYSEAGSPLWTNRYRGLANGDDSATAIAVDANGNVIVTGYSTNIGSRYDFATIAYSNSGVPLWTNRYNGPNNLDDKANAIAVDGSGNVFVAGTSVTNGLSYAIVAYSSTGVGLWTNLFDGTFSPIYAPIKLALDVNGNIFAAGSSFATDYTVIKYSNSGVSLWTNHYNSGSTLEDAAQSVAVDANGNVFVTGVAGSPLLSLAHSDYGTVGYAGDGTPLWTNRYDGPARSSDVATAIAVDGVGNVIVTGGANDNGRHYTTIGYANNGVPLWTNVYRVLYSDTAAAIAVDKRGGVFVTGWSDRTDIPRNYDYATIKYAISVPLVFQVISHEMVISWTNTAFGWTNLLFSLQSSSNISGPFINVAGATSPYTNSMPAEQRFFRLISN